MITFYKQIDNQLIEIEDIVPGCWVNIYPPFDYEQIKLLSEKQDIYIEYFTDALDINEQSRYEIDDDVKFILLNTPIRNENIVSSTRATFATIPISIVVKNDILITTSLHKNPVIDSLINSKRKFENFSNISWILTLLEENKGFF